ncbi:MAG: hypothetical protein HYV24_05140 [Deltaproteobacteria bacterium]|nr:hypothetical protein [Deltaproteobacteria bacterium]
MKKLVFIAMSIISLVVWHNIGIADDSTVVLQQMSKTLDSAIGEMTFDEALMAFGAPESITHGEEIFVASWTWTSQGVKADPKDLLGLSAEQVLMLYSIKVSHGENVLLTFDKQTKLLRQWRYRNW